MARKATLVIALLALGTGCGAPRVVRGITSRGNEIKFLYQQGSETGVIKCHMGPDGALSQCKPMNVQLEE
jgi:hypothetical protein